MEKARIDDLEELKKRIKSEQASKNHLRRDRDYYKQLYYEEILKNKALQEKVDDEINRDWSPVWLKNKLIQAQEENEKLKKYIMALEEKRNFKEVLF